MATRKVEAKGYDNGYKDAIEKIKQMLAGGQQGGQSGQSMTPDPKLQQPDPKDNPNDNQSGQSGSGSEGGQDQQSGSSSSNSQSGSGEKSNRDADSTGKKGIVRAEDCDPIGNIDDMGNEPGGMVDQNTADKVAKKEGYDPAGGSEASTEKEWSESSIKATKHLKGNSPGHGVLKSKIENIYKVSHDWKKTLRAIVGNSISPEDRRIAYANKNVLVSQDRIARTDKDKYDTMDYMMAWIDSSGSMSDDQLKKCLKEIYQVALAKKPLKLVVIQCDTKIQSIKEYTNLKLLEKDTLNATVKGRGGTDLTPCIQLLKSDPKYKRRPAELVMIFTDGDPDQFKRDVRTMKNLCWCILDRPSWTLEYKEMRTKCVHLNTHDIK
jgi:hypothetical protein